VVLSAFHTGHAMLDKVVNNWQLAPNIRVASGQTLNVTSGKDNSLTGLGNDRPDQVLSNVYATNSNCSSQAICVQLLNPAAFVQNPIDTYGNVGCNALRGPDFFGFDVSLVRKFALNERLRLESRFVNV
jgi:hypothetical protein